MYNYVITGIGHSMAKKLRMINVLSVADVLSCPSQILEREFGSLQATVMTRLCHGIDDSAVTPSGEFKSITDEDSFKKCSTLEDARKRLFHLVEGLLPRVSSDTGVPETVRVTVRRQGDHSNKRESRQCRLPRSFSFDDKEKARNALLTECLVLFNKLVDVKKPFHLTLLGVSLANFHKSPTTQSKNISNFFQKSFSEERDSASFVDRLTTTNSAKTSMHKSPETSYKLDVSEGRDQEAQKCSDINTQHTQEKETSMMAKNQPSVCPEGVDPTVFAELPLDLQREIEVQWEQGTRMPMKNTVKTDKVTPKANKCVGIQRYFAREQGSPNSVTFK